MQESMIVKQLKDMTVEEAKLFGCAQCGEGFELGEPQREYFSGVNADGLPDRRILRIFYVCPHCGGVGGAFYEDSEMRAMMERLNKLQGRQAGGEELERLAAERDRLRARIRVRGERLRKVVEGR